MEILVVSKQTPNIIKKSTKLARMLGALVDCSTGKKSGMDCSDIHDFNGDLVITVGGDGTFLWTADQTGLPILPLRAEGVGFLCSADYAEALKNAGKIKSGELVFSSYPKIKIGKFSGVNEIVVTRNLKSKIMRAHVSINGSRFFYKGDGFSVSTMLGSTAYNQSLGGPIISGHRLLAFTPIAPFMRINPMVFTGRMEFEIERESGVAIVDGNKIVEIDKDKLYEIKLSGKIRVAGFKPLNHFDKYIQTLK